MDQNSHFILDGVYKNILPHVVVFLLFCVVSMAYFTPLLKGKLISQPDINQFIGGAKELLDFEKETGEWSYWTNSMFGGMPAYYIKAKYDHNYILLIDRLFRFLPRPASYLFLSLFGFYFLMITMRINYKVACIGAFLFAFTSYFFIILAAGHNSKAHVIAYIPLTVAGILMVFRGNYKWGFLATSLFLSLSIYANHPQMTYYMFLLLGVYGIIELIETIRKKKWKHLFLSTGVLVPALILSLGMNAPRILTAQEYSKYSIRGQSELAKKKDENQTSGLDRDYITQWSYGISESLNLLIPNLMGGSSHEDTKVKKNLRNKLIKNQVPADQAMYLAQVIPTYWGTQPFVAGPAYQGAVVFFLFVLGLFLVKGKFRLWLAFGTLLSLMLAWGKNFPVLTNLFIDYFPLYNKFRAVSSILIIAEFTVPFLAVLALDRWFFGSELERIKKKSLLRAVQIVGGLIFALLLFKKVLFSFESPIDGQLPNFLKNVIQEYRKSLFVTDAIRSLVLVVLVFVVLWLSVKGVLKTIYALILIAALGIFDLWNVDKRYLNDDNFSSPKKVIEPFQSSIIDKKILEDTSQYRVLNLSVSTMNDASTSYFHHSMGGYSGVKLRKFQELYDAYIAKGSREVLNMFNTKYIIANNEKGEKGLSINSEANGNAWFIDSLRWAKTADEEIEALGTIDTKKTAVVRSIYQSKIGKIEQDTTAAIYLTSYKPNHLTYRSTRKTDGFAVFSEVYYPKGWDVFLDGKQVEHFHVNYILRGMNVSKGDHKIEFKFEPKAVAIGERISLFSSLVFMLFGFMVFIPFVGNHLLSRNASKK